MIIRLTNEGLVLLARSEGLVTGLVAKFELGGLGHGVVICAPNKFDGIADRCIDGEGDISKDTLRGRDPDGVCGTISVAARACSHRRRWGHVHGRRRAELSHTFCPQVGLAHVNTGTERKPTLNAVVITAVVPARGAGAVLAGRVGGWWGVGRHGRRRA